MKHLRAAAGALAIVGIVIGFGACSLGQNDGSRATAARIVPEVKHDESAPLRDLVKGHHFQPSNADSSDPDRESADRVPLKIRTPRAQAELASGPDPVAQFEAAALSLPPTQLNIDGVGTGFTGPQGAFTPNSAPPDTNGDVGPNHYVMTVNSALAIFQKDGTVLLGPEPINTLFSGFGGACQTNNDGDPVVQYDQLADRWIISQFSVTGGPPFFQCIAVSSTGDPTGTYFRYAFQFTDFNDYPKMGVWPDAYYFTYNIFQGGTTFAGGSVCAADRTSMLSGATATQQCFSAGSSQGGLLTSDLDGKTPPPAGSPNYVVDFDTNKLNLWTFHVDFATPANSTFNGPTAIPVASFKAACNDQAGDCIPQQGSTQLLATLADRLMYRLAYRNFGDHESLVLNHSVDTGTNGPTGVRWYELRSPGNNPTVFQQATYAPADSAHRWMGSIAMDGSGNIGLAFSISSTASVPAIHYTGRAAGDAAGQMTLGEGTIVAGGGAQASGLDRWGDYSSLQVDPSDDCTLWFASEYLKTTGTFNWSTRVASFKLPGCGTTTTTNDFSESVSPSSATLAPGTTGNYTIATAVTSGTAESIAFAVSGLPAGVTGAFNPPSVTAGASTTLTLTVDPAASAATATFTVTGTAPSASHSVQPSVTISSGGGDGGTGDGGTGDGGTGDDGGGSCAHPICSTGGSLTATCDPCAAQVCGSDPFCCSNSWDNICVGEVTSICGQSCSADAGTE